MSISIVQLGSPRGEDEGLRLGTVRRPPRGVAKADFARLDYYDLWLPVLSPGAELVKQGNAAIDDRGWMSFMKSFRREMSRPDAKAMLDLLAALSHQTNIAVGCYCRDENRCHRSVLRDLLSDRGADVRSLP